SVANRLEVSLEHLMNETFLVLEVVIELSLAGAGRLDDVVRAGGGDALLVKQIGRRGENPPSGLVSSGRAHGHDTPSDCTKGSNSNDSRLSGALSCSPPSCTCSSPVDLVRFLFTPVDASRVHASTVVLDRLPFLFMEMMMAIAERVKNDWGVIVDHVDVLEL